MIYKNNRQRVIIFLVIFVVALLARYAIYPWLEKTQNPPFVSIEQRNQTVASPEDKFLSFRIEKQNTQSVVVTDKLSGISVAVPASTDIVTEGTYTKIDFGAGYYTSFGYSTTTTKYLRDINGGDWIILGYSKAKDSSYCSTVNWSPPRGDLESTEMLKIDGHSFRISGDGDAGMNQFEGHTRFVELLEDGGCRFVMLREHSTNTGVYGEEYYVESNPTYISIHRELSARKPSFYSDEDIKKSLSIHPPLVFRIGEITDSHVYLSLLGQDDFYYKSTEVEKFRNFKDSSVPETVLIEADSFTPLSPTERYYYGIESYFGDVIRQINNISTIEKVPDEVFR